MLMDFRDNVQKCHDYIQALEQERTKIQVFQRELPLCVELVTQAIEACKQQLSRGTNLECVNGHSECSEQTTSNGPIFEEFMPLKRTNSTLVNDNDEENEHESNDHHRHTNDDDDNNDDDDSNGEDDKLEKKTDWLRSVQLWNQTPDPPTKENQPKRVSVVEIKKNGSSGAFHPFQKEKTSTTSGDNNNSNNNSKPTSAPAASACSSAEVAAAKTKEEKGGRKARRCWSPELHRRFLHALQQLGGSHVATPKQIKEMMKVDGLTNDEVKSHLQKYRLHTRRPTPSIHNTTTTTTQTPQFVVVGGIWVPAATTVGPSNGGVYAPVAAPPPPTPTSQSQSHFCEERGSHSEGRGTTTTTHSSSPATSSSTHTTTASNAN